MSIKRPSPAEFRGALLKVVRETYDPGVIGVRLLQDQFLLIQLDILGKIFGLIWVSIDNRLYAYFRSRQVMPLGNRGKIGLLFLQENKRFPSNTWIVRGNGEVAIAVDGLKLRGSTDLRLRSVRKRLFRRLEVMDRRIQITSL